MKPVLDMRAAAAAFGIMRKRLDHLLEGVDWYRVAPDLFAAFGNDQARFAAASDARIAFELGRAIEFHEQHRRAGSARSARKAQASRRNGRRGGQPRGMGTETAHRRSRSSAAIPGAEPNAFGSTHARSNDRR